MTSATSGPGMAQAAAPLLMDQSVPAGYDRIVQEESGTFKYFLKVVPSKYKKIVGAPSSLHSEMFPAIILHLQT